MQKCPGIPPKYADLTYLNHFYKVQSISAEIDSRKLFFLARLCRLDYDALLKKNLSHSIDVLYARFVEQANIIDA
jgi:hypothetical protein